MSIISNNIQFLVPLVAILLGTFYLVYNAKTTIANRYVYPLQKEIVPLDTILNISFDLKKELINGLTMIRFNVSKEIDCIRISAADMLWDLFSVQLHTESKQSIGVKHYRFDEVNQLVLVHLVKPISPGIYKLQMSFGSTMRKDLMGCYISHEIDNTGVTHPFVMSQFEPNYARTCFPTFDEPDIKMPFTISISVPIDFDVVSNSQIQSVQILKSEVSRESDQTNQSGPIKVVQFEQTPIMSAYLVAFGIGHFQSLSNTTNAGTEVVTLFPRWYNTSNLLFAHNSAIASMNFFQSYLSVEYPLKHLQLLLSPNFAAAAMENYGLLIFRGEYLIVGDGASDDQKRRVTYVVAHEIAHQWFGDEVTNEDWSDVFIQEGFATYLGYKAITKVEGNVVDADMNNWFIVHDIEDYYIYDTYSYSAPIKVNGLSGLEAVNSFSAVSYTKSAMVLATLENLLNINQTDNIFRSFLSIFLTDHLHSVYSTQSFTTCLSSFTSLNHHPSHTIISNYISSWINQAGLPHIQCIPSFTHSNIMYSLSITQKQFIINSKIHIPTHFVFNIELNLQYTNKTQSTFILHISQPTKTIILPPSVKHIHIRFSPYLPAIFQQIHPLTKETSYFYQSAEIVRELRSAFFLLKSGQLKMQEMIDLISLTASDDMIHTPHITSLLIAILTEIRMILGKEANGLSRFISLTLQPMRIQATSREWSEKSEMERSVDKELFMFLLRCGDINTQEFVDSRFGDITINGMEFVNGDFQELIALRYIQKHITKENFIEIINSIIRNDFTNKNIYLISVLSAIENDSLLAYLFEYMTLSDSNILTQNIIEQSELYIQKHAKKLVEVFGQGFILKKNLNSFATAGFGSNWINTLKKIEENTPVQFAATFVEFYERVGLKTLFRDAVLNDLLKV